SGNIIQELQSAMAYNECLASYMNAQTTVQSDVYLNQGTGDETAVSTTIALNDGTAVTPR
ncbi:MAG: hypothetical protein LIR46_05240, partial [Bacteroidota bacterium]|nr:hypothetical protein [Bacteroidota bacterium]